jgi:hypothetical protein
MQQPQRPLQSLGPLALQRRGGAKLDPLDELELVVESIAQRDDPGFGIEVERAEAEGLVRGGIEARGLGRGGAGTGSVHTPRVVQAATAEPSRPVTFTP